MSEPTPPEPTIYGHTPDQLDDAVCRILANTTIGPMVDPTLGACWDCSFTKTWNGYPSAKIGGRSRRASRLVLSFAIGRELKTKHQANHKCDRPSCVRPDHLYEGTQADNLRDAVNRGRWKNPIDSDAARKRLPRGTDNIQTKLNPVAVSVIRFLHSRGVSARRLARAHGVVHHTIGLIIHGRTWQETR